MNLESFSASLNQIHQYDVAGTVFMLDTVVSDTDELSSSRIESAMLAWCEEPQLRYLSFDAPLPARVVDRQAAQRQAADSRGAVMAEPLPTADRALAVARCAAMAEAFQAGHTDRAMCPFNAVSSVLI
ncbi:unnamed protein product, partial [Prorocentrum cordatum]